MAQELLDATNISCPELSLSMRRFLRDLPSENRGLIATKESRAHARLKHICLTEGWEMEFHQEQDIYWFSVQKN